jgi:U3 small nucleolar RNA-associated protein 21
MQERITEFTQHYRANRAQYTNVSFQGITEDEVQNISLPSMQGTAEDSGKSQKSVRLHNRRVDSLNQPWKLLQR